MIHVSVDGGEVWNMAQLPTVNHEQFYSILAANQDMIFMHVDNPGGEKGQRSPVVKSGVNVVMLMRSLCVCGADSGVGTIYVSDDRGTVFSKSLERHLYTTTGSDTDFTVITSLRGVYMTSVRTEGGSPRLYILLRISANLQTML